MFISAYSKINRYIKKSRCPQRYGSRGSVEDHAIAPIAGDDEWRKDLCFNCRISHKTKIGQASLVEWFEKNRYSNTFPYF